MAESERTRHRRFLAYEALQLAIEHGYQSVTVDDVASAAGLSRRTFFRCFATKQDAILFWLDDLLSFAEGTARFVLGPGRLVWAGLNSVCVASTRDYLGAPDRMRALHRLIDETAELRAGYLNRCEALGRAVSRLAGPGPDAELAVHCAMAIRRTALTSWVSTDEADANVLIRAMISHFDRLDPVFGAQLVPD